MARNDDRVNKELYTEMIRRRGIKGCQEYTLLDALFAEAGVAAAADDDEDLHPRHASWCFLCLCLWFLIVLPGKVADVLGRGDTRATLKACVNEIEVVQT